VVSVCVPNVRLCVHTEENETHVDAKYKTDMCYRRVLEHLQACILPFSKTHPNPDFSTIWQMDEFNSQILVPLDESIHV